MTDIDLHILRAHSLDPDHLVFIRTSRTYRRTYQLAAPAQASCYDWQEITDPSTGKLYLWIPLPLSRPPKSERMN